jgi:hypothetical protein
VLSGVARHVGKLPATRQKFWNQANLLVVETSEIGSKCSFWVLLAQKGVAGAEMGVFSRTDHT